MKKTIFALMFLSSASLFAAPPIGDILKTMEDIYKMTTDAKARVQMTQQKKDEGVKNFDILWYRRDRDNAFLMVMAAPENEKGNGYLRMDDNFWMYRRNTRTFQHINRDESIGGSDAHGEDFENRKLTEMYAGARDSAGKEKISEDMLGKIPVYKFEVKAIVNDVDYPRQTMWVRRDNSLMLKQESYSSSGSLMQTAYFINYTRIDGRYVCVKQMFIDEFEKGNKTIMEISNISTEKLDDNMFTKAYLENLSK
ncbi:MAG: outer membrane lipoprotein-sorting protein [Fibrobacterota bacterium]